MSAIYRLHELGPSLCLDKITRALLTGDTPARSMNGTSLAVSGRKSVPLHSWLRANSAIGLR